jgi:predicted nucleic acid-binding protein
VKSQVCVDVNLALKLVIAETDSHDAHQLWAQWIENDIEVVAPPLIAYEGISVVCNKRFTGALPPHEAQLMVKAFLLLGTRTVQPENLHERAWELAQRFNRPQAYDSHYLALAEILGIELWTADKRLYNTVKDQLTYVRLLGDSREVQARPAQ